MEGSEVFDAEDGFGVHGLQLGDLGSRETDGWREAAQVEYLAIPGRDLPVSRKVNVVWIGDEVEFAQDFLGRDAFPFGVAKAGETDDVTLDDFEALGVVEDAHAEHAIGSLGCQGRYCL